MFGGIPAVKSTAPMFMEFGQTIIIHQSVSRHCFLLIFPIQCTVTAKLILADYCRYRLYSRQKSAHIHSRFEIFVEY